MTYPMRRPAPARRVRAFTPLLSLIFILLVSLYLGVHSLGVRQISPTNLSWLAEDPATVFFGSHAYRLATNFSPFAFQTDLFGYPGSVSIALFDPMPFFAFFVRVFSPILPMPFQYNGLYLALCFVLQGLFGFALMDQVLGRDRPVTVALATLLLVMMPPFVTRTYGHVALSSHWVLLAALAIYFRAMRTRTMQWGAFLTTVFIAAGINVYISVITLSVFVASACNNVYHANGRDRIVNTVGAACVVVTNCVAFALYGYVTPSNWPVLPTNDFGTFSANLVTFLNPPGGVGLLFREQAIEPGQAEGFGYLGLGTCLLAVIALARDPRGVGTAARHLAPLVAVAIGLFILALMDRIRLGSVTLLTIRFPPSIRAIIGILHANGRFVWLLMYLIPVVAVAALARNVKARSLLLILASAAVLQAAEVIPLVRGLRTLHEKQSVEYEAASSLRFSAAVQNFIVLPPWQCGGTPGPLVPGHGVSAATFQGFVSLLNGLRSNSEYLARTPVKTTKPWCDADIVDQIGELRQDSVYYFSFALFKQVTPSNRTRHWCDVLYDGVLCRPDVATLGESEAARTATP